MAIGIPIVSSNCKSGPSEMLMNGKAGWLFNKNNIEECSSLIIKVLCNEKDALEKVNKGKESCNRYEPKLISKKYQMLVDSLIKN